jgi:hypothetical protein
MGRDAGSGAVRVDVEYPSMAAFADAVDAAFEHRT